MRRNNGTERPWGPAGLTANVLLVLATSLAAFWGTAEFFHEGWFAPYGKYLLFYMLPMLVLMGLTLLSLARPGLGGSLVVGAAAGLTTWRFLRLRAIHAPVVPSLWLMGIVLAVPGLLLLLEARRQRRVAPSRPAQRSPWTRRRQRLSAGLPLVIVLIIGLPLLVRNLGRPPLTNDGPVTIQGNGLTLTFAGRGPGWLDSNRHAIVFAGKTYAGLSWNEIALFGRPPLGFEGKRFGPDYDGTVPSIRDATQAEFQRYNMFRYIDPTGTRLTRTVHDAWRLPTAGELVAVLTRHGENAGGRLDPVTLTVHYTVTPDKEAPLWDPAMEVIYYWTATSADARHALDISYSGRVRPILKTTAQDYRGFRAVRTVPAASSPARILHEGSSRAARGAVPAGVLAR